MNSHPIYGEKCYASPFNFLPEVRATVRFAPAITIADCTLRDGEQHPGIVFSRSDKLEIARALSRIGIGEIEAGMPVNSKEDEMAVKDIVEANLRPKITVVARSIESDIDLASRLGVWGAVVSAPIGDLQRKYKLRWSDDKYITTVCGITEYAKKKGLYVVLSPFDTTRVDLSFLKKVLELLSRNGLVDRVRLVDTVGSAMPNAISYLVAEMKDSLGEIPIEIHCHNDFGLAMANSMAALASGAEVLSCTINGIGERAGNTATEEAVAALQVLYGIDLGINLECLYETSQLVQRLSNVSLQSHKAVVGEHAFSHESGMVVAGLLKMPFTAECCAPEIVGQKRSIIIGKKSGKVSIEEKLKELGIHLNDDLLTRLVQAVKQKSIKKKGSISDKEFLQLVEFIRGEKASHRD